MPEIAQILYASEEIREQVRRIGRAITEDFAGRSPVLISVLKGSALFLADLVREIRLPMRLDFMSISSYGPGRERAGRVRIVKDLDQDIGGQDVVLVEDIIDTGLTASYLLSVLRSRSPSSLHVCTLLDKSVRRIAPLPIRYRVFDCPDKFVVGYGLDYAERYRNLPFILAVEDYAALAEDPELLTGFVEADIPEE